MGISEEKKNIVQTVLEENVGQREPFFVDDRAAFVVLRKDDTIQSLESYQARPDFISDRASFESLVGFISYCKEWSTEHSRTFGHEGHFKCVVDYHESDSVPSWGRHRASLDVEKTNAWSHWFRGDGHKKTQKEFANFLEERLEEIKDPSAADILAMVKGFQSTTSTKFVSVLDEDNVMASLQFKRTEEATTAKGVQLPKKMTIVLRPFRGVGELFPNAYEFQVRLNYHITEGMVSFSYNILRKEEGEEKAFDDLTDVVEKEAGVKIYKGGRL